MTMLVVRVLIYLGRFTHALGMLLARVGIACHGAASSLADRYAARLNVKIQRNEDAIRAMEGRPSMKNEAKIRALRP